ncbi:MAG: tetratricopeptide repeat protein [Hyphomonadaceae bacterium]|nr:tetratricopeptide repeat protein [Hyphomonadaceae bacterium]
MSFSRFLKLSAAVAFAGVLAASCGKSFAPGTAGSDKAGDAKPGASEQTAALDGKPQSESEPTDPKKALENLSQDLLDKLKMVPSEEEAASIEEEIWDAWLVSGSPTVDIMMKRGLEYQEAEDVDSARHAYDTAIAIKPDYAEAWNRRALLFFNDGKYDEAVADLESALIYEPRHFGAWIGLGMIFESIERPEAALKAYRKALEIHPHAAAALQGEKRLVRAVEGMPI